MSGQRLEFSASVLQTTQACRWLGLTGTGGVCVLSGTVRYRTRRLWDSNMHAALIPRPLPVTRTS